MAMVMNSTLSFHWRAISRTGSRGTMRLRSLLTSSYASLMGLILVSRSSITIKCSLNRMRRLFALFAAMDLLAVSIGTTSFNTTPYTERNSPDYRERRAQSPYVDFAAPQGAIVGCRRDR